MKIGKWIVLPCFLFIMAACATTKEGAPSGKNLTCPDGPRPMMDCRMAFDQYKSVLKFDLNIIQNFGTGVGVGAQPLISLDSITGDLMAHQYQVCLEYNNCMISKNEYVAEQRYLRRAQLKIREMANSTKIGIENTTTQPPPMGQTGDKSLQPDLGVDQKLSEAQTVPAPDKTVGLETIANPVIFEELKNLENKMQALVQQRGIGVAPGSTPPPPPADLKPAQKVNIEYTVKARRPKTSSGGNGLEYDPIKFSQGSLLKTGDQFKISFMTDSDAFVYVINFDGSGKSQIIFPHPEAGATNFVKGGQTYEIPSSPASWYYLDEVKGHETLYVIASPFKIPNLDALVSDLKMGKDEVHSTLKTARLRGSLEALTRGVGVAPDEKAEKKGETSSIMATERIEFSHQ